MASPGGSAPPHALPGPRTGPPAGPPPGRRASGVRDRSPVQEPRPVRDAFHVRDLRGRSGTPSGGLVFATGDLVVISGLPGSGKSTLIRRATGGGVDSQDARERWARRLPLLPYALYRPVVRLAHYAGLWRLLRSGRSVVVHDCGTQTWVRRWLAREARGRGRALHLVLIDVPPEVARAGQRARGRAVSRYAFARHRRAVARLLADVGSGRLPGCRSAVLLDREAVGTLGAIVFADGPPTGHPTGEQGR
ncbi:AAA family ATPase [Streptomyces sp. NBC_01497]|uniref:AAA family ATPase n=1 Tax=Streptomyces sp. NBC_01497 TaxID=2903885 RepID=UPI003FCC96A1